MAKIKHIAISAQDPAKTAGFYKSVFDLQEVGRVDNDIAEGYYLSDGHINLAILRFKNETVAGEEFGTAYSGLHHIGFQVEDSGATDAKLRAADCHRREDINSALHAEIGGGHGGRNVETKYGGPDGVMVDVSQAGWVGTDAF
jgi:catechol 2,3-dioxygenase-like lactoylglutathione lyase family enzyme